MKRFTIYDLRFMILVLFLNLASWLVNPVNIYAVSLAEQYPFGHIGSVGEGFDYLVPVGFSIAATALLMYLIIGGFRYLASGGNKDTIASARAMMTHGIIGFILLIVAFILLQFIPQLFGLEQYRPVK